MEPQVTGLGPKKPNIQTVAAIQYLIVRGGNA